HQPDGQDFHPVHLLQRRVQLWRAAPHHRHGELPLVSVRAALLSLHRWTGLVLAGFLCLVALTGIALAWYDALDTAAAPALHRVPPPTGGAARLDALALRERVARFVPAAVMPATPLGGQAGRSVAFPVWLHEDGAAGPVLHEIFIDPYDG